MNYSIIRLVEQNSNHLLIHFKIRASVANFGLTTSVLRAHYVADFVGVRLLDYWINGLFIKRKFNRLTKAQLNINPHQIRASVAQKTNQSYFASNLIFQDQKRWFLNLCRTKLKTFPWKSEAKWIRLQKSLTTHFLGFS